MLNVVFTVFPFILNKMQNTSINYSMALWCLIIKSNVISNTLENFTVGESEAQPNMGLVAKCTV